MPLTISASFDDASASDTKLADLMDKYDIETVFYWPVNWKKINHFQRRDWLSDDEADDIASRFEIGGHTVNHRLLTRIPENEAGQEILMCKHDLERRFQKPVTKFAYPRGYYNQRLRDMVQAAGFELARTTLVGYRTPYKDPYQQHTTVHVGCDRREYKYLSWMEYALEQLELVVTEASANPDHNFQYHFWGHGWELDETDSWEGLKDLLDCIHDIRSNF